jgi:thioredoxin reductase
MGHPQTDKSFEYLIVGAGPAGVQVAYYLQEEGKSDYMILEKGDKPGYFFEKFPLHRTLISINKRYNYYPEDDYNLRHDWNSLLSDDKEMRFTKYSDKLFPPADTLVKYMADYCKKFNIKVTYNTNVEKISRNADGEFVLRTNGGVYRSKVLIMATGAMKEKVPDIPGIELATKYGEHSTNQEEYANKKITIIGGGNSAFETADHLAGHAGIIHIQSHQGFRLAWDTHFPGDLRAINNSILDMFHLKSIHGLRKAEPTKIEEVFVDGKRKLKFYFNEDLPHWSPPQTLHGWDIYDDIILCTGWYYIVPEMWDASCKPEASACGKYPKQKGTWESTNISNLFFAGTCTQGRDREAASSFIHGFRYSARVLGRMLNFWRHNVPLPMETFNSVNMDDVAKLIIKRFSTSSALYQLNHGVLCDVIVFKPQLNPSIKSHKDAIQGTVQYYYELPSEYVINDPMFTKEEYLWLVIFEDGKANYPSWSSPVDFALIPKVDNTEHFPCQPFIKPTVRHFKFGKFQKETVFGGNFVVRVDQHQVAEDQLEMRCINLAKRKMCEQFGISSEGLEDKMFPEGKEKGKFSVWSDEKIKEHKMMQAERFKVAPCRYQADPPEWSSYSTMIPEK